MSGHAEFCGGGEACLYFPDPRLRVSYVAGHGEANTVSVRREDGEVTVRDSGAALAATEACHSVDDHRVSCGPPLPAGLVLVVQTGDGADSLSLEAPVAIADLGPGRDAANGSSVRDVLRGAGERDVLNGLGGDDVLDGGAGDDLLQGVDGFDALDGGPGRDTLSAGTGVDVLSGGPGNDRLRAGPEADRLTGGPGRDSFSGGAGADGVDSADGVREVVRCGAGRDQVLADRSDVLVGCERRRLPRGTRRATDLR